MSHCPAAPRRARPCRRPAIAIVAVLVSLAVISALGAALIVTVADSHRQSRRAVEQLQAEWLAESALERAATRLADDAAYAGEDWRIEASQLDGRHPARVEIRVTAPADNPSRRRVAVVADYPAIEHFRVRHAKQWIVDLPDLGE